MAHEILENDQMFSVKEVPWHGLGEILDSPPSIKEALEKANLTWTVSTIPIFTKLPKSTERMERTLIPITENRAVLRNDTKQIIGIVGERYTPLQNEDAFQVFQPLVEDGSLILETAGSLKNGRRVWVLGKITSGQAEISKDDLILPYVLLSNSHDGTKAVRFGFTPIRVVCNNTLTISENDTASQLIRVVHSSNVLENVSKLRDILDLSKAVFTATIEQYKLLASKEISENDLKKYITIVLPASTEENEKLSRPQRKVIDLFESGLGAKTKRSKTWWGAYNAVNEFLVHHRGRSRDNRLDSLWFGQMANVDKTALNIALKMVA